MSLREHRLLHWGETKSPPLWTVGHPQNEETPSASAFVFSQTALLLLVSGHECFLLAMCSVVTRGRLGAHRVCLPSTGRNILKHP